MRGAAALRTLAGATGWAVFVVWSIYAKEAESASSTTIMLKSQIDIPVFDNRSQEKKVSRGE
jgi:hypothetical protein